MAARSQPKDALVHQAILKEMGITEYEPKLINQMLEFSYRYITDVLEDARVYSQHAGKKSIDPDDLKLAVQYKLDHSFTNPPPRDLLLDIARHKNSTPLPIIKPFTGPRLPPDRYCLTTPNFTLRSNKKPPTKPGTVMAAGKFLSTQSAAGKPAVGGMSPSLTLVTRAGTAPSFTIKASLPQSKPTVPAPIIRLNTGVMTSSAPGSLFIASQGGVLSADVLTSSLKRKRDDDLDL